MKLVPLQQWICDECGRLIEEPDHGWLEWIRKSGESSHGYRIVHHKLSSPKGSCYYYDNYDISPAFVPDMPLDDFLGVDGLAILLAEFAHKHLQPQTPNELVEIIRRLHLPYYEEARLYFETAKNDGYTQGFNEHDIYMEDRMKRIIEIYGDNEDGNR